MSRNVRQRRAALPDALFIDWSWATESRRCALQLIARAHSSSRSVGTQFLNRAADARRDACEEQTDPWRINPASSARAIAQAKRRAREYLTEARESRP